MYNPMKPTKDATQNSENAGSLNAVKSRLIFLIGLPGTVRAVIKVHVMIKVVNIMNAIIRVVHPKPMRGCKLWNITG